MSALGSVAEIPHRELDRGVGCAPCNSASQRVAAENIENGIVSIEADCLSEVIGGELGVCVPRVIEVFIDKLGSNFAGCRTARSAEC